MFVGVYLHVTTLPTFSPPPSLSLSLSLSLSPSLSSSLHITLTVMLYELMLISHVIILSEEYSQHLHWDIHTEKNHGKSVRNGLTPCAIFRLIPYKCEDSKSTAGHLGPSWAESVKRGASVLLFVALCTVTFTSSCWNNQWYTTSLQEALMRSSATETERNGTHNMNSWQQQEMKLQYWEQQQVQLNALFRSSLPMLLFQVYFKYYFHYSVGVYRITLNSPAKGMLHVQLGVCFLYSKRYASCTARDMLLVQLGVCSLQLTLPQITVSDSSLLFLCVHDCMWLTS